MAGIFLGDWFLVADPDQNLAQVEVEIMSLIDQL
ncbi:hypothetical protein Rrhod_2326 [Rhodococcus rhodnii LMG 5362]|uniref:Uncharacterized protein n=1 Tax=Rhodococcus rhodnii LMG 5362 TaxID=1273125 RepID=R7WM38_9NOCA|nr:hypothetical protein Rrhod_2326 [Rhodococcus rhodnii LMG 5362]